MRMAHLLRNYLREKMVSAFVTIQLNGYHRVVNKKVTHSKVSLRALVKHIKLKTSEGGAALSCTEVQMLRLLQRTLFRPLLLKEKEIRLFQKWKYACDGRSQRDTDISSSQTLIRSGLGRKWQNPLTIRHFQHLSRSVSCIIFGQLFSIKRLNIDSYSNAMVQSRAMRAWKRRVFQEQKFQNDGETVLTETHFRLIGSLLSILRNANQKGVMRRFNRWRKETFKYERPEVGLMKEEAAREFERDVVEVQAKVNSKLEGELGVLNSVYIDISSQQLNLEVSERLEKTLGGAVRRAQKEWFDAIAEHKVEEFRSKKEYQQVMLCLEEQADILQKELQASQELHIELQQEIESLVSFEYNCEECVLMRKRINMNQRGSREESFLEPFQRQITDNSQEENDLIISSHSNTGRKNLLMIEVDSSSNQADRHPKTSGATHNRAARSSKNRFTPYDPFCNLPTMSSSTSSYQKHAQMQFSPSTKNTSLTKGAVRSERKSEMEVLSEQKQHCEEEEKFIAIAEESNSEGIGNVRPVQQQSNQATQRNELGDQYVKWLRSKVSLFDWQSNFYCEMLNISDEEFFHREETDDSLRALQFQVAQLQNEAKPRDFGLF